MLYLVSNGETQLDERKVVPVQDDTTELTIKGQSQGIHIAEWLKMRLSHSRAVIIHGPTPGSYHTANLVFDRVKGSIIRTALELKEVNMGTWSGRPLDSLRNTYAYKQYLGKKYTYTDHDGESLLMAQRRINPFLEMIKPLYMHTSVVIVGRPMINSVIHSLLCKSRMGHGYDMNPYEIIAIEPREGFYTIYDTRRS